MINRLAILLCLAVSFAMFGQLCSANEQESRCDDLAVIKKNILNSLNSVDTYQLNATVAMDGKVFPSQIAGKLPNRLRITQKIHHNSEELDTTVVFDGRHQWVESKLSKKILQVIKIRLSEVVDSTRPFDTGYYLQGTGIFSGEDFPSTVKILLSIYKLTITCTSDKIVLSGHLNEKKFEDYASKRKFAKLNKVRGFRDQFKKNFKYASLLFSRNDYLLRGYLLGSSDKNEKVTVIIKDVKTNIDCLEDEFEYQIPNGIVPNDITDELKRALNDNGKPE